jgi:alpha-glucosidase
LLEIVGITSTDKTFVVGFGYMECEKMENYCWVLEKLKALFIKQDLFPHVILTDRELALMNAIEVVFPHAVNLLCTWHINKNVNARCGAHVVKDMRKLVKQLWQNIVFSQDEAEYQQRLNEFEQACAGSSKFLDYVNDTWLNPHRQRFVEAWTNRVMHLGNTTTNRYDYAYFTKMYFV